MKISDYMSQENVDSMRLITMCLLM